MAGGAAETFARAGARLNGAGTRILYPPIARLGRRLRSLSRRLRGKQEPPPPVTRLPAYAWPDVIPARPIYLTETGKRLGNVTPGELAFLATAAAGVSPGSEIIEIGTFDGRTTLNLAINSPAQVSVNTLDLPRDTATQFDLVPVERQFVDKPMSGERFRKAAAPWSAAAARITQLFGDSATFDWSPHYGRAGLVFVDGSHAYDYAKADSETAFRLLADKGVVIWHDYGVWEGVTRALEEIEASRHLGLRHVRGTSLVVWRRP